MSTDVEVIIPEPEKYLGSQKTPQFPGNASQASGSSFSFKWSTHSSMHQETTQLKSVVINLNPEVKDLETWIIS